MRGGSWWSAPGSACFFNGLAGMGGVSGERPVEFGGRSKDEVRPDEGE